MVLKRSLVSVTLVAALVTTAAACNGDAGKATTPPSTTTTSQTPTPSDTPSSAASATPSVVTPPAAKPRTKAELTKALLALSDLPAGLSVDDSSEEDGSKLSSKDAGCKDLVTLFNAHPSPGAKAFAERSFTGGQSGPFFDETLDAMGSPAAVTALLSRTRTAIKSCKQAKLTIPGVGSSTMAVSEIAAPKVGTSPVGARFTADGGALDGLEAVFLFTGLDDVALAMSFDSADGIEEALGAAAAKAKKVLGTAKSGT
ncbi:hypothetical protein ABZS29_36250 [Kribbella sp. NPDC005582]|uniref:hypothetical protein n=1 Tax=Kribbella sp. NPDC005582 TaxID=3156893 RepID=UPI0033B2E408